MYDLLIIGGGPAGYAAAIRAARLGGRVLVAEADQAGGTCLHYGCIPAKVLTEAARQAENGRAALASGLFSGEIHIRPDTIAVRQQEIISSLYQGLTHLLRTNRVTMVKGRALARGPGRAVIVSPEGKHEEVTARKMLIATGSRENRPTFTGASLLHSIEDSLTPPGAVCRVAVVGGGASGLELAGAYQALGFDVVVIEQEKIILPMLEDEEISKWLAFILRRRGVRIHTSSRVTEVWEDGKDTRLLFNSAAGQTELTVDLAVLAAGRSPNLDVLGEGLQGLEIDAHGAIVVNQLMETGVPGVYAAGDVTGPPLLAHLAYAEGITAAENAMGRQRKIERQAVPHFLGTSPQLAWVGLTEQQAARAGLEYSVGRFDFAANSCAQITGRTEGFVKIVSDQGEGTVLGMQILGERAPELIMEGALAVQNRLHFSSLARAIHPHPTLSEAVWEAALALNGGALHEPRK